MVHSGKVMLIDDNPDCREIVAAMIRLMGYEVTLADDKVPIETADVIVVYLDSPPMSAIHTIRALRENERLKDTPMIAFLPSTYKDDVPAALDAGANAVFDGPLKIELLKGALLQYFPSISDHRHPTADCKNSTIE